MLVEKELEISLFEEGEGGGGRRGGGAALTELLNEISIVTDTVN